MGLMLFLECLIEYLFISSLTSSSSLTGYYITQYAQRTLDKIKTFTGLESWKSKPTSHPSMNVLYLTSIYFCVAMFSFALCFMKHRMPKNCLLDCHTKHSRPILSFVNSYSEQRKKGQASLRFNCAFLLSNSVAEKTKQAMFGVIQKLR